MDRLEGFLRRRRRIVLAAWVVVLVAAFPFTLRQTENLTSGGFDVPGSGSEAVDRAITDFEGAQRDQLAVVLAVKGGDAAAVRRAVDRVDRAAAKLPHVELTNGAEAAAKRQAGHSPIAIARLRVTGTSDQNADVASNMRDELGVGDG